jgi:hypothetical protein
MKISSSVISCLRVPQRRRQSEGRGLHRLGGGGRDPLRLTIAIASPDVSTIQLRSQQSITDRAPGVDGFSLLGITHTDPITYAHPLDARGSQIGSEPLLL